MQKHFTLLFIGADCISSFATTGCSHFVSIKPRKTVTDQIIFTRAHTYIALLPGIPCVAQWVPQLTKMLTVDAIFDHLLRNEGMFESQTLWCEAVPVMCLACGESQGGREGGRDRERWLTRGPSILRVTVEVHSVRLVSLMCITLAWRVMEGGRLSRGAREWLILHILEEEQERRYPCAWLMA